MNKYAKLLDIVEQEHPRSVKTNPNSSRYSTVARYAMLLALGAAGATASGCMGPIGSFKTMVVARDVRIVSKPGDIKDYSIKRNEYNSKLKNMAKNNRFRLEGEFIDRVIQRSDGVDDILLYSLAEDIKQHVDIKGRQERYSLSQLQTIYENLRGLKLYYEGDEGKKAKNRDKELEKLEKYTEIVKLKLAQKHVLYGWNQEDQQKKSAHLLAAMILTLENNSKTVNEFVKIREVREDLRPLYDKDKFDEIIAIPYPTETCIAKRIHGGNTGLTSLYFALMATPTFAGLISIGGDGVILPFIPGENPITPIGYLPNNKYPLIEQQHKIYPERFYGRGGNRA